MGQLIIIIVSSYRLTFIKTKNTTKKQDTKETYAYSSSLEGRRVSLDSEFSSWPPVGSGTAPGLASLQI